MPYISVSSRLDSVGRISIPKQVRTDWKVTAGKDSLSLVAADRVVYITPCETEPNGRRCRIDPQGRIVIPKLMRKHLGLRDGLDTVDIRLEPERLVIFKHSSTCIFCQSIGLFRYRGIPVCERCVRELYHTGLEKFGTKP